MQGEPQKVYESKEEEDLNRDRTLAHLCGFILDLEKALIEDRVSISWWTGRIKAIKEVYGIENFAKRRLK
jgi:hypothetical protein